MNLENIETYLEEFKAKEDIIKTYDEAIIKLNTERENNIKELEEYSKNIEFSIPLKDLINEISEITETPVDEIKVLFQIPLFQCETYTDKEKFINSFDPKEIYSVVEIYGEYIAKERLSKDFAQNYRFFYSINMPCNLDEMCTDDKTLKDKFDIKNSTSYYDENKKYTSFKLKEEEEIDTIICHIKLYDIANTRERRRNHPNGLLKEAILNYKQKQDQKIKKLK